MAFGIKIKGQFLDLLPNTTFGFELSNPAYLGDKIDVISNGIVFSTKVPLTPKNLELLEYPNLIENDGFFVRNEPAEIVKSGRVIFSGLLKVGKSTSPFVREQSAEVSVSINNLSALKGLKMNELDLGVIDPLSISVSLEELATETCLHPHDYPYVFHTVWNPDIREPEAQVEGQLTKFHPNFSPKEFQNQWFGAPTPTSLFGRVARTGGSILTPFLKLTFLLERMFAHAGFSLRNDFQNTDELQLLTVYNNRSMHEKTGDVAHIFPLNQCASATTCDVYLGRLARLFSVVPFANVFTNTVELVKFSDILARPAVHDWTHAVTNGGEISQINNYPTAFGFKAASDSSIPKGEELAKLPRIQGKPNLSYIPSPDTIPIEELGDAIYSFDGRKTYVKMINRDIYNDTVYIFEQYLFRESEGIQLAKQGEEWQSEITPLSQARVREGNDVSTGSFVACVKQKIQFMQGEKVEFADHLIFYRGLRPYAWGNVDTTGTATTYRFFNIACAEDIAIDGKPTRVGIDAQDSGIANLVSVPPQYSMIWAGENGLYNRFWRANFEFLRNKKDVTVPLLLTIDELMAFSFADKIRIKNMEYLVKKQIGRAHV